VIKTGFVMQSNLPAQTSHVSLEGVRAIVQPHSVAVSIGSEERPVGWPEGDDDEILWL
jgi:hypothetical protein